jgi:hypothetical protein
VELLPLVVGAGTQLELFHEACYYAGQLGVVIVYCVKIEQDISV